VKHGGAVTVTGGASFWQSNGSLEVDPSGSVGILSGGAFLNTWSFGVFVDGSVTVKGGSTWSTINGLNVLGTLTVSDLFSRVEGDINIYAGGLLKGNATAASAGRRLHNDGVVAPGDSVGALFIGGNYTQTAAGTLQIELAGTTPRTKYDQLLVTGSAALAGTLQVSLINGFTASAGMSFDILNWGSLSGTFSTVQLPALAGSLGWDTSQFYTTGVLSVILPGDFNFDGIVDGADYVVWRKGLGTIYTQNDYNSWRTHFGQTAGSGAGTIANAAVPEPATVALIIVGVLAMSFRRRTIVS
jgi:hypothetical protein